jgi:hypothetical protein
MKTELPKARRLNYREHDMNWQAKWINPEPPRSDAETRKRASYLRRSFTLTTTRNAKLYITAHEIYNVWLNGAEVKGFLLASGAGHGRTERVSGSDTG